ncbi:choice-of-anchor I family protein [Paraglaciecola hydrolytica]|uniref:Alkaline phosphatase n=1 Tax=Paraglaciecola hydrolytica TaxID=1799789 RepID=A0A148KKU5_9ALTE|nr:choice-of-anchor I family protein [Paraglaciecola hydrolytica]KXI26878.1 alkaline phosphatase [Paraglaciecola hydrolytica]
MKLLKNLSYSAIALALSATLTGCFLEGDDGVQGETGSQGPVGTPGTDGSNGTDGANGQNANAGVRLELVGRAQLNPSDPVGAAEIVQYHAATKMIYAVNSAASEPTVEMIDASTITSELLSNPLTADTLNATPFILPATANNVALAGPTSVAVKGDWMAVAAPAKDKASNGYVLFYNGLNAATPVFVKAVEVGNLPDMVTFNADGSKVVTANEGEPSGDYGIDPEGSISVITFTDGVPADTSVMVSFSSFNDKKAQLAAQGMHFPNPAGRTINGKLITTSVAQDLEPEYITIVGDMAYVTLQENNGIAMLNLSDNSLTIKGLGYKDWSQYQLDGMEDGKVSFGQYQDVYGLYMPDTIASFSWKGAGFIVTANEGDAREYFFDTLDANGEQDEDLCEAAGGQDFDEDDGCLAFTEETQARDLDYLPGSNLDTIAGGDPRKSDFTANPLGRLTVTSAMGDSDNDGVYEAIYAYGARSFTIWDSNGLAVFDSGDDFERITASIHGNAFNNNNDENIGDDRSANKGPEPEALTIGQVGDRTYAFIGLERMGGIFVYDITNPYDSKFVDYVINRDLTEDGDIIGDSGPEGMVFVSANDSPSGVPLVIIGNEISGTVAVWQVVPN